MKRWRSAPVALGFVAMGLATCGHATGLFLPVDPADGMVEVAPATKSKPVRQSASLVPDTWERRVRVVRDELAVAREDVENAGAGRLLLNVRDGVRLDVVVERTAPTNWGYSLSGRVAGGGVGFVTLVVHEDAVAGSIWTPDAAYELGFLGGGVHALRDVTAASAECAVTAARKGRSRSPGMVAGPLSKAKSKTLQPRRAGFGTIDSPVLDILVLWTPAREAQVGGESSMRSLIDLSIAYTNDALDRSGAFLRLRLIGARMIDYAVDEDSPFWTRSYEAFDALVAPSDGRMDDAHRLRDELGADLVNLVYNGGGLAQLGDPWFTDDRAAFSASDGTPYVFAHEIGHNLGLVHQRDETHRYSFSAGFVPWRSSPFCFSTIMASWGRCNDGKTGILYRDKFPYYSSPWRYHPVDGRSLGVSRFSKDRGLDGPANAVLRLDRMGATVANYRQARPATGPSHLAVAPSATDASDTPVTIPDAVLRKWLTTALEKRTGDVITRGDMASLQRLWWSSEYDDYGELTRLDGIEYAMNLTSLGVGPGHISDLAPLSDLTSLRHLLLLRNEVTDLSPLVGLTRLEILRINGNRVSELAPLSKLTSLSSLELAGNAISNVRPLATLTSLSDLSLKYNGVYDVDPLVDLVSLRSLNLGWNRIGHDIDALSRLAALRNLQINNNGISDLTPLADLTDLTWLDVQGNRVTNVAPLLNNSGLGESDLVNLTGNPLSDESIDLHIPELLDRGVHVRFDEAARIDDGGAGHADLPDGNLRRAIEAQLRKHPGQPITVEELASLEVLDGADLGIADLDGLESATTLTNLDLSRNVIRNLSPLTTLASLWQLYLDGNQIDDVAPLGDLDLRVLSLSANAIDDVNTMQGIPGRVYYLALDNNMIRNIDDLTRNAPPDCYGGRLNYCLGFLYLSGNSISDIASLADIYLRELDVSGNSIESLAPLGEASGLAYLFADDNEVADISPLNFWSLRELHMANNAVRDISPLLDGKELLMADVRRNPLADDALGVIETLRERRVTVLAGETVPYFPAAGDVRQGFVRVVNRGDEDGHAFIEAVDDAGVRAGPVRLSVQVRRAVHFNSGDLENGNAAKGLSGGVGAPTAGDWRLSVISALDLEVLSYIRTEDGFVTAMHDVAAGALAPFFNPGSNRNQRSILRVVNTEAEPAKWTTGGYDDAGKWHSMAGSLLVRPQHALTLTAQALEDDHGLGDGRGKWRLRVRGFPWYAMSLLESPTGHLTNLSTAPDNAVELGDGRTLHRLPLFPAAGGSRQGFVRVINRSYSSGEVVIEAVDDAGTRSGPVRLTMRPRRVAHFNSMDLEVGNADKGLDGGVGAGQGDWRLEVTSELDLMVLTYARTVDGFLTSLHDLAPVAENGGHRVVFFNPGSNTRQVSKLRLINDGERAATVAITGIDDAGRDSGTVSLTVPSGSAPTFTSAELEAGDDDRLAGRLGNGAGKWRLRVRSDEPIAVMSLLETPSGHLTNVSTGTAD